MSITAALGIANTLGTIISTPIQAICNSIAEKSKMKMQMKMDEHKLEIEARRVRTELEKKQNLAKIDADIRRWNEEINDFIAQKEIERNKKILDAIMLYQRTMLEDYASIMANISAMELRLADTAHKIVIARTEDYMKLQEKAKKQFYDEVREIREICPDNAEMQKNLIETAQAQRMVILNSSQEMISTLNKDITRINEANSIRMNEATQYVKELSEKWSHVIGVSNIHQLSTNN